MYLESVYLHSCVLIVHAGIGGGATGEGLPEEDTKAPYITGWCVLAIIECLRREKGYYYTCTHNTTTREHE